MIFGALKAFDKSVLRRHWHQRATVNGKLSLNLVRKIVKSLQANHGENDQRTRRVATTSAAIRLRRVMWSIATPTFEPDIRDLPGHRRFAVRWPGDALRSRQG